MNERIKELAEQNGFIHKWQPPGEQYEKLQTLEKFAELIVRECGKVAFDDWCEGTNESSSEIAILKHFNVGVEQ